MIPKGNKIIKKNIQKFKSCVKTRRIQIIKPIIEDKTAKQFHLVAVEKTKLLSLLRMT